MRNKILSPTVDDLSRMPVQDQIVFSVMGESGRGPVAGQTRIRSAKYHQGPLVSMASRVGLPILQIRPEVSANLSPIRNYQAYLLLLFDCRHEE
jgi:hypothetical protein